VATLVCYLGVAVSLGFAGRILLPVSLPWASLARAAAASVIMYLAVAWIHPHHGLVTVGVRAALGVAVYVALMMLIDADARVLVRDVLRRFRRGKAR
jgi:Na+/proline symporter